MGRIETRKKILEGAFECFSTSDFHDVKMIEIARQAGVGKGTVYEYFESKEELYYQLFNFMLETYLQEMEDVAALKIPVKERIVALYEKQIRFSEEMRDTGKGMRMMEQMWIMKRDRPFKNIGESIMALFKKLIELGVKEGSIRENMPMQEMQMMLVIGLPALCHTPFDEKMDPHGRASRYVEMIFDGIGIA
ncbi:TetR/AcrR family transcriptional regulator [Clostridia bacterium]|nr:TetR/AcrR family transcriptional regulator [Clostridia bacterium]